MASTTTKSRSSKSTTGKSKAGKAGSGKTRAGKSGAGKSRWIKNVTTDSTHPPKDLFTKSAPVIARSLASKKVSPKGPASGMRMLTYYINRAGKGLSATRKAELERAKKLLHQRIERESA
jgi:tRNA(adenine34) deaminase